MVEGIRWLVAHPPMRTLALTIFTFNVTFGAAWSVLVLYAGDRLRDGRGRVRAADDGRGGRRHHRHALLRRAGAPLQPGRHHAGRAADRDRHPSVARPDDVAPRSPSAPGRLRRARVRLGHHVDRRPPARRPERAARPGRRASTGSRSSAGSWSARRSAACSRATFGITAPFWFAFVGSALLVTLLWRQFEHIAHAEAPFAS